VLAHFVGLIKLSFVSDLYFFYGVSADPDPIPAFFLTMEPDPDADLDPALGFVITLKV